MVPVIVIELPGSNVAWAKLSLTGGAGGTGGCAKIGRSAARALQDQELLLQEDILSENGAGPASRCISNTIAFFMGQQLAQQGIRWQGSRIAAAAPLNYEFAHAGVGEA